MKVSAHQFNREFATLVQRERGINRAVVERIAYCVKHSLYAELGHANVARWLIDEHGYPKNCAYRRIAAAKLVTSVPQSMEKLESGSVNLSTLATLQQAIRNEEQRTAKPIEQPRREALLEMISSKTEEQTERLVAIEFPELVKDKVEFVKPVSATETRVNVVYTDEEMAILRRVKEVTAHSHFNAKWSELTILCAKEFLKHHDPLEKAARAEKLRGVRAAKVSGRENKVVTSPNEQNRETNIQAKDEPPNNLEHGDPESPAAGLATPIAPGLQNPIAAGVRNQILKRDEASCVFVDPISGRRCGCREGVEVDHIIARALGGSDEPENLRTLCRTHNLLMARRAFGSKFIDRRIRENKMH